MDVMITGPDTVKVTLGEAAERLQSLEEQSYEIFEDIRSKQKELVRIRFKQCMIVHHIAEHADYGDGGVQTLSERTGMSDSLLYEAKRFYELPKFGQNLGRLNAWMNEKEEKRGKVNWSYCRNVMRKSLEGKEDTEAELNKQKRNLERRAKRLEQDASDLEEEVMEMEEKDEEALGVAAQARTVAEDLQRQADRLEAPKQRRLVDEEYLDFVREQPCCVTGRDNVDPHHLISVGAGGPDYTAIPLTRKMHNELHDRTRREFEHKYNVNLWKECVLHIIKYLATR